MVKIRRATKDDVPTILHLVRELAIYEKEPNAVVATEADFIRDGFGDHPRFHVHLAESDGTIIGFALWFFTWSTWRGTRCLHLEDLFVLPEHRKKGAGLLLMKELARAAVDTGCARFIWQVLDWNEPSIEFYKKLGANVMNEWIAVRLEGAALHRMAEK